MHTCAYIHRPYARVHTHTHSTNTFTRHNSNLSKQAAECANGWDASPCLLRQQNDGCITQMKPMGAGQQLLLFAIVCLLHYYRMRGSASYIVREVLSVREREIQTDRQTDRERERERERDGSDVTIVALKLAMNLHFPLPKIRTIGDELTLSLAKNSHFSFLPSHFPSLPSRRGHHCDAEIRNEFTLSIAKIFFSHFVPPLSNGTSRATSDRKTQDK